MFPQESPLCSCRRGKMQIADATGQPAVHLFREGLGFVVGTKTRLYMSHGDVTEESRKAADKCGERIPLDQHHVRFFTNHDAVERVNRVARDLRQRLAGLHDVQVVLRPDAEYGEHLIQHMAVLRRRNGDDAAPRMFLL